MIVFLGTLVVVGALAASLVFFMKWWASGQREALPAEDAPARSPRSLGKGAGQGGAGYCMQLACFRIDNRDLDVSVYVHDIAPGTDMSCWTFVSDGLHARGQKEVVFMVARREDEPVDAFPKQLLDIYAMIDTMARQGRRVDIGGYSELGPEGPGLLGRQDFRGILYTPPQLGPFPAPRAPFLTAVVLTRAEVHAAMALGMVRMMALFGEHSRFYPMPPWSDRDRPEIAGLDAMEESLIAKVARTRLMDATVCEEFSGPRRVELGPDPGVTQVSRGPSHLHLRVGPKAAIVLAELLVKPETRDGFALVTGFEPTADACYVWRPGQTDMRAIGPEGRRGDRVCGNFILFVPAQPRCEFKFVEDGFGMALTDAAWAELRAAIVARLPLAIAGEEGQMSFELSWLAEARDQPTRYGDPGPYDA